MKAIQGLTVAAGFKGLGQEDVLTARRQARPEGPIRVRAPASSRRPVPTVRHIVLPFVITATVPTEPGERIVDFIARSGWATLVGRKWSFRLPTICVVNGEPVLQRNWRRRRIRPGDVVEFWSRPWGGGGGSGATGKAVLGIVALVALAAFAGPAGVFLAGGPGFLASAFSSAILIGGGLLVAPLMRPTARPKETTP